MTGMAESVGVTPKRVSSLPVMKICVRIVSVFTARSIFANSTVRAAESLSAPFTMCACSKYTKVASVVKIQMKAATASK